MQILKGLACAGLLCYTVIMSTAYLFFGKSGSGKGTQAQLLKSHLESQGKKVIYIETGKLFRDFAESHTGFIGEHIHSIIDGGNLMPPFFPVYLWSQKLIEQYTGVEDIITDGVARRVEEAPMLDSAFNFLEIAKRFVITIDVSDQWVIDHMRAQGGRADDTPEGIQKRLSWFGKEVMPAIKHFENDENYQSVIINGDQTIEQVAAEIQKKIM